MLEQTDLRFLNDRLADVLVMIKWFKAGILANPNWNQDQKKALIDMSDYIYNTLVESKKKIQKAL